MNRRTCIALVVDMIAIKRYLDHAAGAADHGERLRLHQRRGHRYAQRQRKPRQHEAGNVFGVSLVSHECQYD